MVHKFLGDVGRRLSTILVIGCIKSVILNAVFGPKDIIVTSVVDQVKVLFGTITKLS